MSRFKPLSTTEALKYLTNLASKKDVQRLTKTITFTLRTKFKDFWASIETTTVNKKEFRELEQRVEYLEKLLSAHSRN